MLSYFLADDTLSIFEPPQRNTGITGGKYLERSKVLLLIQRFLCVAPEQIHLCDSVIMCIS